MRTKLKRRSAQSFFKLRFLNYGVGAFLLASISTAGFYDPSLFHLLSPSNEIQNWFGITGALVGGSLLELLGIPALLLAWFVIRPPSKKCCGTGIFLGCYYAVVIILNLSILQVLLNSFFEWRPPLENLLWSSGYLGRLGGGWMLQVFDPNHAFAITGGILLFAGYRIFPALPFLPLALTGLFLSQILITGLEKLYRNAFPPAEIPVPVSQDSKLHTNSFVREHQSKLSAQEKPHEVTEE